MLTSKLNVFMLTVAGLLILTVLFPATTNISRL